MKADKELIDALTEYKRKITLLRFDIIEKLMAARGIKHSYHVKEAIDEIIKYTRENLK